MSTSATMTPTPAFPPPIPITYTWSTPNALRRLALPPLATDRVPSPSPPRAVPPPNGFAGPRPSRSIPVGRRPLPRPPVQQSRQNYEIGQVPFPDPYAYQMPSTLVHHYHPEAASTQHCTREQVLVDSYRSTQAADHNRGRDPRPSSSYTIPSMAIAPDLVPLIHQPGRLSFSEHTSHPAHQLQSHSQAETTRGRTAIKSEKERKNGMERRLSISSVVAIFTGRKPKSVSGSRSRSRSGSGSRMRSRDQGRNLLDDE